jgi:DNA (cytosine-5)-methyltransferase 1
VKSVLEKLEATLLSAAETVTPEGTEPRAVIHQWLHAIAHNLPLFAESRGVDKTSLIKSLENQRLFKDPVSFYHLLTANLPIVPPRTAKFTFIDLFAGIGGTRIGAQNNGGVCVFSSEFEKNAQKTYLENHGEFPFGDITKISVSYVHQYNLIK